jgi:Ca2+-binding RTX toxin-like protein
VMQGLSGNDALLGRSGADLMDGGEGDDFLLGGLGADTLVGGAGVDVIAGSMDYSRWNLRSAAELEVSVPDGASVISQGLGWKLLDLSPGSSYFRHELKSVFSFAGDYWLEDEGNVINAGSGRDLVLAGVNTDVVHGDDDDDTIYGLHQSDVLFGDEGDDRLFGDGNPLKAGAPYKEGFFGNDLLIGGQGHDRLYGQGQADRLFGDDGDDLLMGIASRSAWTCPNWVLCQLPQIEGGAKGRFAEQFTVCEIGRGFVAKTLGSVSAANQAAYLYQALAA